ncbi:ABC transporter permease [Verrucomicrobiota bacterium]
MKAFASLFRRQLTAYFYSPMAYVTMAIFLVVSGLSFFRMILQSLEQRMQIGDLMFGSVFFWFVVLVAITLITMHLFAEEKRIGTIEVLLTAPVTDTQVVMAKYFGALTFFVLVCTPTVLYVVIIRVFCLNVGSLDIVPVITGYFVFLLISACCIAFGLFVSSLTRSQVVAGMICFAGICMAFFSDSFQYIAPGRSVEIILGQVSSVQHIMDFSQGIVDTRPVVLYLSGAIFFLFATVKVIEARQWK